MAGVAPTKSFTGSEERLPADEAPDPRWGRVTPRREQESKRAPCSGEVAQPAGGGRNQRGHHALGRWLSPQEGAGIREGTVLRGGSSAAPRAAGLEILYGPGLCLLGAGRGWAVSLEMQSSQPGDGGIPACLGCALSNQGARCGLRQGPSYWEVGTEADAGLAPAHSQDSLAWGVRQNPPAWTQANHPQTCHPMHPSSGVSHTGWQGPA